jgi:7,8-dihydropterin-6-yl-methyl-4-(beta-D-ribofuranosyl)aminobenzene 5'-phosphate synthase
LTEVRSLVIEEENSLTLVTGCAHPGIAAIAEKVRKEFGSAPLTVGGFHFHATPREEVVHQMLQLQELGVQRIVPCHCTGEKASFAIQQIWDKGFVKSGAGWEGRW